MKKGIATVKIRVLKVAVETWLLPCGVRRRLYRKQAAKQTPKPPIGDIWRPPPETDKEFLEKEKSFVGRDGFGVGRVT